jgi:hypothetical protein
MTMPGIDKKTIKEKTGKRNLDFSGWIRRRLPDSYEGYVVSDLDFVLCNERTKKLMLIEAKCYNSVPRPWQKRLFSNLDRWIRNGIDSDWDYLGFHWILFSRTSPSNGYILFDGKAVTEEELIKLLSF